MSMGSPGVAESENSAILRCCTGLCTELTLAKWRIGHDGHRIAVSTQDGERCPVAA
jgi:hypothetical protein